MTVRNDPEVVAEAKERFADDIPELADAIFLREVVHLLRSHQEKNPAVNHFIRCNNLTEIYPTRSVMAQKELTIRVTSDALDQTAWFDPDADVFEVEAAQRKLEQLRNGDT